MRRCVNRVYRNTVNNQKYVIKGAWSGDRNSTSVGCSGACWLMRENGEGHAYAGYVTAVKNVWDITIEEFEDMTSAHVNWFRPLGWVDDDIERPHEVRSAQSLVEFSSEDLAVLCKYFKEQIRMIDTIQVRRPHVGTEAIQDADK